MADHDLSYDFAEFTEADIALLEMAARRGVGYVDDYVED